MLMTRSVSSSILAVVPGTDLSPVSSSDPSQFSSSVASVGVGRNTQISMVDSVVCVLTFDSVLVFNWFLVPGIQN